MNLTVGTKVKDITEALLEAELSRIDRCSLHLGWCVSSTGVVCEGMGIWHYIWMLNLLIPAVHKIMNLWPTNVHCTGCAGWWSVQHPTHRLCNVPTGLSSPVALWRYISNTCSPVVGSLSDGDWDHRSAIFPLHTHIYWICPATVQTMVIRFSLKDIPNE
jgi:hypothetical protein